jgi:hypothetical protein
MNRRTFICGLGGLVALLPSSGYAQSSNRDHYSWGLPWKTNPEIVVIPLESDERLPAIRDAVDFWNAELSKLGTPFRFGSLTHVVETIPSGGLSDSRHLSAAKDLSRTAKILRGIAPTGDVIVALSNDTNFKPFAQQRPDLQQVMVVIPDLSTQVRTLRGVVPNAVMRNAVAHELGHAIGLGHNDDVDTLMCGAARCGFRAFREAFLPITPKEQTKLLEMYPPSWQPRPFRKWIVDPPYRLRELSERLRN